MVALLCLMCGSASAERITLSQAKALAASYMKTSTTATLARRSVAAREDQSLPLYVFSRGEGQGFVMISGDDALPIVLGYTDTGDFDEDNLPPALQDMIEYYSAAVDSLAAGASAPSSAPRKVAGTKDIAALIQTHWHQSWPYNNLCPYISNTTNRAATGCVATAASQIIYYWHKDLGDRTKYTTPTYGYGDAPVTETIPSGTPLKWNLMQESYGGSEPDECTEAVATLVAVTGISGWLTYGSSTAGQISDQVNVFSSQFGLNGGATVWKSSYSQSTWESMIVQDLELGRPILYSGVNASAGGHAVVIDGYQLSTNLFHFNFGWGAGNGYDGYYTVDDATGMNGFNDSQGMVWNVYPRTPNVTGSLQMEQTYFVSRVANTITAKITNNGTLAQSGYYLYCLTGTNTPSSSSTAQASETQTSVQPGSSALLTFSFTPSSTNTYTVYLCDGNKNILDKITDIDTKASVADLTLNSMAIDDGGESETLTLADGQTVEVKHVFNSKKANVTANFTNGSEGTLCTPSVQGIVYQYDGSNFTQSTTKTKKNVTFEEGGTEDIVFDLTSLTDDVVYKFALAGTASTNKQFDISYAAAADTAVYFRLVGANLTLTPTDDGQEQKVTGNYNATVFESLASDSTVSRYDMTEVIGLQAPLTAANKNALFYLSASQGLTGTNIVVDMVCDQLDLTPGYNFQPREDFRALSATYHATQAQGRFGTALLPFDADTPSGLFARKVNEVKTMYLQDVDSCNWEMKGGTPYIILAGEPIDITAQNTDVSILTPSLGTDTLRGTWTNIMATDTQWMLDDADTQYFNACEGSVIPALTAYMEYTKKVRVNSTTYNTKDAKAKQLAQQIESALATLNEYANVTSASAQAAFTAAIDEARDTLRSQPLTSYQTSQIKALETAAETYVASASSETDNGLLDMTALISNPSFELGNTRGWTATGASVSHITTSLSNYMSGADGSYVINLPSGTRAEQTIEGVEKGVYQLVASLAADYDNHIVLSAGTDSVTVTATDFGPMYMEDATVDEVEVTDGTLTISVHGVEGWAKADNFRLYQISGDSTPVESVSAAADTVRKGIYDLSGRRLATMPARGICIVDGKKVIR